MKSILFIVYNFAPLTNQKITLQTITKGEFEEFLFEFLLFLIESMEEGVELPESDVVSSNVNFSTSLIGLETLSNKLSKSSISLVFYFHVSW
jgi:hypothetical protein